MPLAERLPALRAPLYEAALQRLVPLASYPPGFTSWAEEGEVDEDAFLRLRWVGAGSTLRLGQWWTSGGTGTVRAARAQCVQRGLPSRGPASLIHLAHRLRHVVHLHPPTSCRSQSLPELLECAYGLLRAAYVSHAWQLLQGAASWQAAEAALYLVAAVSLALKARVLGDGGGGGGDENAGGGAAAAPAVAEDRRATQALLAALFGRVCSPEGAASMLGAHPALAQAACRLVEHYSSWFGRAAAAAAGGGAEPPLQGAFQLLLRALSIPQVRSGRQWWAALACCVHAG